MSRAASLGILFGSTFLVPALFACSVTGIISNVEMVEVADAIVRAKALEYVKPPQGDRLSVSRPQATIRFKVVETLKGPNNAEYVLPGYLSRGDDFNDKEPPYEFVRPGGRGGGCFATFYRKDGEFLLFMVKDRQGELTVQWGPLAPVNEQLHSETDPWLLWVRDRVKKLPSKK